MKTLEEETKSKGERQECKSSVQQIEDISEGQLAVHSRDSPPERAYLHPQYLSGPREEKPLHSYGRGLLNGDLITDRHRHRHFVDEDAYGGGGTTPRSDQRGAQARQCNSERGTFNSSFVDQNGANGGGTRSRSEQRGGHQTRIPITSADSTPEQKPADGMMSTREQKPGHRVSRAATVTRKKGCCFGWL
ncbi:hypothetical protein vseg_010385 [Gypsophila vaccaria]